MSGAEKITMDIVRLALNASTMTHKTIANNIANSNTLGYSPVRVNFQEQLNSAAQILSRRDCNSNIHGVLSGIEPRIYVDQNLSPLGKDGVNIDDEMANMAENTVHYQALLEAISKKMSLRKLAIKGG